MAWSFSNPEQTVQVNLVPDSEHGNLNGNITFFGQTYAVGSGWSAAAAVTPERRYTVFSLSGIQPALPQLQISASGVIFGSGDQPTSIVIDLSVASSADGTLSDYSTVLYNDGALDGFDHVVVLMLENRSFDNLLGFLYPQGPLQPRPWAKPSKASPARASPIRCRRACPIGLASHLPSRFQPCPRATTA
jgi:hypothetical protein